MVTNGQFSPYCKLLTFVLFCTGEIKFLFPIEEAPLVFNVLQVEADGLRGPGLVYAMLAAPLSENYTHRHKLKDSPTCAHT